MKKLVKESLNEKIEFKEDSDPIKDMSIGGTLYMVTSDTDGYLEAVEGMAIANSPQEAKEKIAKKYNIDIEDAHYFMAWDMKEEDKKQAIENATEQKEKWEEILDKLNNIIV